MESGGRQAGTVWLGAPLLARVVTGGCEPTRPREAPSTGGTTGGDGRNDGQGSFFEGAIASGNPPGATDDAAQANIVVAAGYRKNSK